MIVYLIVYQVTYGGGYLGWRAKLIVHYSTST